MKLLLYQIRTPGDPMLDQEFQCFSKKIEPVKGQIGWTMDACNILSDQRAWQDTWRDYDLVLVGGSGDYGCVQNTNEWFFRFCDTLREIVDKERPLFCSCFGHQALAVALGGEVITDKARAELGTHQVTLNEKGLADPLLGPLGQTFGAQFGHNDQVSRLPQGATNLASTPLCPVQAYKLDDKMVYATQFHPELDASENRERAERYFRVYNPGLADPLRLDEMFHATDAASTLLPRFLTQVQGH